jgi:hypothetical protein
MLAMLATGLMLCGCKQDHVASTYHPAKVDSTEVKGIMRVTLDAQAAKRIGLETVAVAEEKGRTVVPYGAIMYDTKGETWTFISLEPLVFRREKIVVEDIQGDRVILAQGPPAGTQVVTVGAAELMGAEHKHGL